MCDCSSECRIQCEKPVFSTSSKWDQFKTLLWKNIIVHGSVLDVIIWIFIFPLLFILLLLWYRIYVDVVATPLTDYPPFSLTNIDLFKEKLGLLPNSIMPPLELLYSPNTSYRLERIIEEAASSLGLKYNGYANAKDLEKALILGNYLAGVQFDDTYPKHLSYALRFPSELRTIPPPNLGYYWFTTKLKLDSEVYTVRNPDDPDGGSPTGYLREAFLPIQHAIAMAFLKLNAPKSMIFPEVVIRRFPYPKSINDRFVDMLPGLMPISIGLTFLMLTLCYIGFITLEKKRRLKRVLIIMGVNNWLHWTAWFTASFIFMALLSALITMIVTIKWSNNVAILSYSNPTTIFLFLIFYAISVIVFSFMFSCFFSDNNISMQVRSMIWVFSFYASSYTWRTYHESTLLEKCAWCLIPNVPLYYGFYLISYFEANAEGLQWSNLFSPVSVDDNLTVGTLIFIMLMSSFIFLLCCLYTEQISGEVCRAKKWNFFLKQSFWCCKPSKIHNDADISDRPIRPRDSHAFEKGESGQQVGMRVNNLCKILKSKILLNDVSMNMYEGEITVLLGHNGAGKSLTIDILTGMNSHSTGKVKIYGRDIRTEMKSIRPVLGVCLAQNILIDEMSVEKHIIFFSRLKGIKAEWLQKEAYKYLKMTGMMDKSTIKSAKLSNGQRRILSLCCALCGNSKVVFCDNPTTSMTPLSRKQFWNLLLAEKSGRTILLTTHCMDETDALGDRIAIMCHGELKCYGTPFFLKRNYGSGYQLICVKRANCNVLKVTALLTKYVPGIKPLNDTGAEIYYALPQSYAVKFEEMFEVLESQIENLNLEGFGIATTTMEEVLMKVDATDMEQNTGSIYSREDEEVLQSYRLFAEKPHHKDADLLCNQMRAMILKKLLFNYRHKYVFLMQIIVPVTFIVATVLLARTEKQMSEQVPMTMDLAQYSFGTVVFDLNLRVALQLDFFNRMIGLYYLNIVNSYGTKHIVERSGNKGFVNYILDLGREDQVRINTRYLVAATMEPGQITAWFNNQLLHTAPLSLNLVHNAMARAAIDPKSWITVTNAPLPYNSETVLHSINSKSFLGALLAYSIGYSMCIVTSLYTVYIIKERESRAKLLQLIAGIRIWMFWLSHFIWDVTTNLVIALITVVALACMQVDGFVYFSELARYFLLIALFCFAVIPFIYIITLFFTEPQKGITCALTLNFLAVIAFVAITTMREFKPNLDIRIVEHVLRIMPIFSLIMSLWKIAKNGEIQSACATSTVAAFEEEQRCKVMPSCCTSESYFGWDDPGVLPEVLAMIITGVTLMLCLLIAEYRLIDLKKLWKTKDPIWLKDIDDDVSAEKRFIITMTKKERANHNLVLDDVTKYYRNFPAVNQISMCAKRGESIGVIGANGAGKSALFRILTGDERMTFGFAYVRGMSLETQLLEVYREIGYSTQTRHPLFEFMTAGETVLFFSLVRGIRTTHIPRYSEELAKAFGFIQEMNVEARYLSVSNKRKLGLAIAVIGVPTVIYLDAPTTGIDPVARRQLWNIVNRLRDTGRSIILSSNSMEECEVLCTRLAIMVNGELMCLGSSQHLKNKFSKGLILKMKIKAHEEYGHVPPDSIQKVMVFVEREFPLAVLLKENYGLITFYIPRAGIRWYRVFGLIERKRESLNIETYSISQTSLEEIFLQFALKQKYVHRG